MIWFIQPATDRARGCLRPLTVSMGWVLRCLGVIYFGCLGPAVAAPVGSAAPVSVTTITARQRDLPVTLTTTGTVTPLLSVEVRPQVSGVVTRVHVQEGQFVRAGERLFTLDSRLDEANVAKAQAQIARGEAALADARRQLARSRELVAQNFVSQSAVDANQTLVNTQQAALAADHAALDAARVALSHSRIVAPGSGRVGLMPVLAGSSVQANLTTLLTITQLDPIAVAFTVPQRELGAALAALSHGGAKVSAVLPESAQRAEGRLRFVDSQVDASSGTVKAKAVFPNPRHRLWPGAYVNVTMTARVMKDAVVLPQACIVQGSRGTMVFVVAEGQAVLRPVKVLHASGEEVAVSGVEPDERVVLEGRQNLRPGVSVVDRAEAGGPATRPSSALQSSAAARSAAP